MSLIEDLTKIEETAKHELENVTSDDALEAIRLKFLGRKGELAKTMTGLRSVSPQDKPKVGQAANRVKKVLQELFDEKLKSQGKNSSNRSTLNDLTMPGTSLKPGGLHPITQVIDEISDIFSKLGFTVASGPEMETDYYNFEALNIPADHPSRDSFDTFYLENGKLLRSQTSTVQIHVMQKHAPPIKVIAPGKVYRPDATDASHSFMFHQIEGLMIDEKVSFAELKGVLMAFAQAFYGKNVRVRFRPHFFPFTEPSAEMDMLWSHKGKDKWLEILGAGMVHPHVLEAVKLSPEKYSGFAFGLGVERIAMLRWGVQDIRFFYENDIRFLRQFS
jgi:phenylalanyl-tRNA synthetase alpha chain